VKRRSVLALLGTSLVPLAHAAAVKKIGALGPRSSINYEGVGKELERLGYVEGRNVSWHYEFGETDAELRSAAMKLVSQDVDVIMGSGTSATLAAKAATNRIPVVGVAITNPVELGVVDRLGRPSANVTGVGHRAEDVILKQDEALRSITAFHRLGLVFNPNSAGNRSGATQLKQSGIKVVEVPVTRAEDLGDAFRKARSAGIDSVHAMLDAVLVRCYGELARLSLEARIPSVAPVREFVEAGGLVSYGADLGDVRAMAARYIDRILKGAKVSELPFIASDKIELAVNLKTARALSLTIPKEVLARAELVIQ
jgi:putative ABC transport system substrate-binding protein